MADDLLFVYSSPGPVPLDEFTDWYDNEHVPARLALDGFGPVARFAAADGLTPEWLATYEVAPGTLEGAAYQAVWDNASAREKRIMATATIDRRVYSPISDSAPTGSGPTGSTPAVLMAVSMSVPSSSVADMEAWYVEEHIPMLLAVPGWRRSRRYRLAVGDGPRYLSLHEIDAQAAFDTPEYKAAVSTPWRNRIVASAIGREKRVFELHKAFG
ncbi:MAG TPA: hypothetical protein VHZ33_40450 [Trebonia sp.]|jgi:hypothetical protein|nr:hypothetical protein [Trebonia sp.]